MVVKFKYQKGIRAMINKVAGFYFSPSGGTARITEEIVKDIANNLADTCIDEIPVAYYDLLREPPKSRIDLDSETIAVIGLPCYTGRIPLPCIKMLKKIRGNGALTVAIVVYGNSSYGDSLYELCTFAEEQGFVLIGAGSFISEHHMFPHIAEARPDSDDFEMIDLFAQMASAKLRRFTMTTIDHFRSLPAPLEIKGSMPSKGPLRIPIHPSASPDCIGCGTCAQLCPVHAISKLNPNKVNLKKCISCSACVRHCKLQARGFYGPMAAASKVALEKLYYRRKEPEWFL